MDNFDSFFNWNVKLRRTIRLDAIAKGAIGRSSTQHSNIPSFHHSITLGGTMGRKNINRGFKKLRVWQDAVSLYILACKILTRFPFELKKVASNAIDAAHSISRNISEGYCRRGLKEYLNHLNIALGSCGEFHSSYCSFHQAGQISNDEFEELDDLHYRVENGLIKLIKSLQKKQRGGNWMDQFVDERI